MFHKSTRHCHIVFFTKPSCPLCDKALALLEGLGEGRSLRIRTVNILSDPVLYDTYSERIPVLLFPDGTTVEPPIRKEDLEGAIERCTRKS